MKTRTEVEAKQFYIKMQIAKLKKKSFVTNREKNNFEAKFIVPLQNELLELSELWGKLP